RSKGLSVRVMPTQGARAVTAPRRIGTAPTGLARRVRPLGRTRTDNKREPSKRSLSLDEVLRAKPSDPPPRAAARFGGAASGVEGPGARSLPQEGEHARPQDRKS